MVNFGQFAPSLPNLLSLAEVSIGVKKGELFKQKLEQYPPGQVFLMSINQPNFFRIAQLLFSRKLSSIFKHAGTGTGTLLTDL